LRPAGEEEPNESECGAVDVLVVVPLILLLLLFVLLPLLEPVLPLLTTWWREEGESLSRARKPRLGRSLRFWPEGAWEAEP